jgi:hypothetical protein
MSDSDERAYFYIYHCTPSPVKMQWLGPSLLLCTNHLLFTTPVPDLLAISSSDEDSSDDSSDDDNSSDGGRAFRVVACLSVVCAMRFPA